MKVLHLSSSDSEGGAARAAYRLHRGLLHCGVKSQMHVQCKCSDDPLVSGFDGRVGKFSALISYLLDSLPVYFTRRRRGATFSPAILPDRLTRRVVKIAPEIIHLHWISGGFLKIETLSQLKKPIVWTLHDMWPFTGGCHYAGDCNRYAGSCGLCPALGSNVEKDLSRRIWQRKAQAWQKLQFTIVTPSRWMAECASASSLFSEADIRVIPNGIDTALYRPLNRFSSREILGLPQERRLILFGAMSPTGDPRKGFIHLLAAIKDLAKNGWGEKAEVLVFGGNNLQRKPDFGMNIRYVGNVCDDNTMVLLYAAADAFVAPSIQDNLPNTVMEALACGTPVVAFRVGGMSDMIDHGETGWLARPFDYEDLAKGIITVIGGGADRRDVMGRQAREKVKRDYAEILVTKRHMDLYEELLATR